MIIEIPENYPEFVKRVLRDDIAKREENDPVRKAYELANEMHKGARRGKAEDSQEYITHPLSTYDLVRRCVDTNMPERDVIFAASLLHDGIEDYKPQGIEGEAAREAARVKVREKFSDNNEFKNSLLVILEELTNPIEYKDEGGKKIDKPQWQIDHIAKASHEAKLVKICDQTTNLMSFIDENLPEWSPEKAMPYIKKADDVTQSAYESAEKTNSLYPAICKAHAMFKRVKETVSEAKKGFPIARFHVDLLESSAVKKDR